VKLHVHTLIGVCNVEVYSAAVSTNPRSMLERYTTVKAMIAAHRDMSAQQAAVVVNLQTAKPAISSMRHFKQRLESMESMGAMGGR
jgi:hypothetical protein